MAFSGQKRLENANAEVDGVLLPNKVLRLDSKPCRPMKKKDLKIKVRGWGRPTTSTACVFLHQGHAIPRTTCAQFVCKENIAFGILRMARHPDPGWHASSPCPRPQFSREWWVFYSPQIAQTKPSHSTTLQWVQTPGSTPLQHPIPWFLSFFRCPWLLFPKLLVSGNWKRDTFLASSIPQTIKIMWANSWLLTTTCLRSCHPKGVKCLKSGMLTNDSKGCVQFSTKPTANPMSSC